MNIIDEIELEQMKEIAEKREIPEFAPGDVLKVHLKVVEGTRERIQIFEGLCIARSNRSINSTLTVRKISNGEGVERVFPLYSPLIEKFEVVRRGDVRRAKLYYIRGRSGKKARITEKRMDSKVDTSSTKLAKDNKEVKENKEAKENATTKETADKK
tara:strand:- start:238 stop:708 length:471 start_codon:yes stop_codon:yes gene_type:complete